MVASEQNKRKDWATIISNYGPLDFEKQSVDLDGMSLFVSGINQNNALIFRIRFSDYCAYKMTLEEHWIPWDIIQHKQLAGPTNIVENSTWVQDLRTGNDLLDILEPNIQHFVILTTSFTLEILSKSEPEIEILSVFELQQ